MSLANLPTLLDRSNRSDSYVSCLRVIHAADESLFLLKDYHIQALTPKMQELVRNRPKVEDVIHDAE